MEYTDLIIGFLIGVMFITLLIFFFHFNNWMGRRRWLKRNRVFFDTFGAIALSLMAIFVSIGAFWVSSSQASYHANQVELENQPEFMFTVENDTYGLVRSFDPHLSNFSQDYLVIKNKGKPFKNLSVEYSAIAGTYFWSSKNTTSMKYTLVPINHYVNEKIDYDSNGNVRIIHVLSRNYGNAEIFERTFNSFQSFVNEKGDKIFVLAITRYLKIEFDDIYGKPHENYYIISDRGENTQITKKEYDFFISQVDFLDTPSDIDFQYQLPLIRSEKVQSDFFNKTFFEPWYHAIKKKN